MGGGFFPGSVVAAVGVKHPPKSIVEAKDSRDIPAFLLCAFMASCKADFASYLTRSACVNSLAF
jgi:hypothetical protein